MGYPLKKIMASLPPGPCPPIFISVAELLAIVYHYVMNLCKARLSSD